ncbi:MAG: 4-alpha-glucanotransferase [Clostridiaceae bacterium]|jgi:4-alpha-glucanotransferase|nr:4-alpha-glucanotransferase [Clostridiaceae bacterium]
MYIQKVGNNYSYKRNNLSFQRRLRPEEEPDYHDTIVKAEKELGVNNVAMIIHGTSFPSLCDKTHLKRWHKLTNYKGDIGVGNPYSMGADNFINFLKLHGFNSCQLGPGGQISREFISPYKSGVFSKNELFINLPDLSMSNYAKILPEDSVKRYVQSSQIPDANYNMANYENSFKNIDRAMTEAYFNFVNKLRLGNPEAVDLNKDFEIFKNKRMANLVNEAMFDVLTKVYRTDDCSKWNEVDANLIPLLKAGDETALKRYSELVKEYSPNMDRSCFIQFIADKQIKDWNRAHLSPNNFGYINDLLVGFSNADVWANKEAFLKNMRLGCPSGGENNGPQYWNIPVLDPDKLFNDDGTLGASGKLLKAKIEAAIDGYSNVRIDHAIGLIDPFIYNKDNKYECGFLNNLNQYDPKHKFHSALEKIVLPTLKSHGIDYNESVWENLGSDSDAFRSIYYDKLHLPGISQLAWDRAENIQNRSNWALVGSHDNEPAIRMAYWGNEAWNRKYLAGYLHADPMHDAQRYAFENSLEDKGNLLKAKFTELFRSTKNLQISFADFFGINKTYNKGGTESADNWKLRLNNDFEDTYYKALEDPTSNALNMPEILKKAIIAKNDYMAAKANDKSSQEAIVVRRENADRTSSLVDKLNTYAEILKEKD